MAASRKVLARGCFSSPPFSLPSINKLEEWVKWKDVEERIIDKIKATLPDAELALWAMEGGVEVGGSERAVHQKHVCYYCMCVVERTRSKPHCCTKCSPNTEMCLWWLVTSEGWIINLSQFDAFSGINAKIIVGNLSIKTIDCIKEPLCLKQIKMRSRWQ